MIIAKQWVEGN